MYMYKLHVHIKLVCLNNECSSWRLLMPLACFALLKSIRVLEEVDSYNVMLRNEFHAQCYRRA